MYKKLFLAIFLLTSMSATAQIANQAKLDSLFRLIEKNHKGMGSVSIFQNGKEVYQRSIGYADIANKIPANANSKYRIGSITKMFTATIVMQLIEEGKLKLNTKLDSYFPKIPNADKITIEHLLRHRSGLFNFTNDTGYSSWMEIPQSKEELLNRFIEDEPIFEPGTQYEYSNTNYVLLSFIIEKIESKPYSKVLSERIASPSHLQNTYYGGKINSQHNEAFSYTKSANWQMATETDMSIPTGAGAIVSTPTDINIFLNHLFTGKLVSDSSLTKMKKMVDGYGLGMFQFPFGDKKAYGHNGGIDGFQSSAGYFPVQKMSVAYISNGVVMPVNDIIIGVLSIYFDKKYQLPDFKPAIALNAEDLDKYLGIYSSPSFPLKVTISKKGNALFGQATGQPSFPLEAYEKDKFRFEQAGLKLIFKLDENLMILQQRGAEFEMKKE